MSELPPSPPFPPPPDEHQVTAKGLAPTLGASVGTVLGATLVARLRIADPLLISMIVGACSTALTALAHYASTFIVNE